jgi:hypothetical protein
MFLFFLQYLALHKRSSGVSWVEPLTEREEAELIRIEEKYRFDDLVVFQTITDSGAYSVK